ncbi:MAG: chromosome segregation protein SMC, partial [Hyphomonadaceae bacterium]|nr:chromosome segregation protein SMC [Clostridia bacterium]
YRFRIVTLEGELLNVGGSMTGGSVNKANSFLSRVNEIEQLTQEIEAVKANLTEQAKLLDDKTREVGYVESEIAQNEKLLRTYEARIVGLESDYRHLSNSLQELHDAKAQLTQEEEKILLNIDQMAQEAERLASEIEKSEVETQALTVSIDTENVQLRQAVDERAKITDQLLETRLSTGVTHKELEVALEKASHLMHENNGLAQNITDKRTEILTFSAQQSELDDNILLCQARMAVELQKLEALHAQKEEELHARNEGERSVTEQQAELRHRRDALQNAQAEFYRMESKRTKTEQDYESMVNKLWDEYTLTYSAAEPYRQDVGSLTLASKQIGILKAEIRSLGNVNVNAIEEYLQVKERYEFLSTQIADLEVAEGGLLKIIQEMVGWMKKQFESQFVLINEHFNEVFMHLFGGGRAALRLADPSNVLESGIEIDVQPPGKKLQSILLLSGGEKAMSAIALLFAILKVRPTPFCILDEIEAALDEVNVFKFGRYLHEFSGDTQFLVVTHRRGTMEAANILYGVTMQEKGVSTLLQLKFEEIEKKVGGF